MEIEKLNLFLITSVINPFHESIYSAEDRLKQLTNNTIRSIKNKIPKCHIVVIEGSKLSIEQIKKLKNSGINELLFFDVNNLTKNDGELSLLLNYFDSIYFNRIKNNPFFLFHKISGRYYLSDEYDYKDCLKHPFAIKKNIEKTWSGHGTCDTRYYRMPFDYVQNYINILKSLKQNGIFIDLEHSFFQNEIIPFDKIDINNKLNIKGNLAPNGQNIFD